MLEGDHQNGQRATFISGSKIPMKKKKKLPGKNTDFGRWHVSSLSVSAHCRAAAELREAERAAGYM